MDLSAKGAAFLRAHEGFVAQYYLDPVKVPTIGIGFTWASDAFRQWWGANKRIPFGPGASMTRQEAEEALIYLVRHEYGKAVNGFLRKKVPQHVFDAMVSAVYNLGPRALTWKWAAAAKAGNYAEAASLLRNTGTTAQGKKLAGLVRRRQEEGILMEKGIYTGVGGVEHAPVDAMADGILRRREAGPAVAQLIRDLATLGYYNGIMDDLFGPATERAVMAFQTDNGLKADGLAGPVTLAAIAKAVAAKSAPQKPVEPSPAPKPAPAPERTPEPATGGMGTVAFVLAATLAAALVLMGLFL